MKQIILSTIKDELIISDNEEVILIDDLDLNKGQTLNSVFKIKIGKNCQIKYLCFINYFLNKEKYQEREIILGDFSKMISHRFYLNAKDYLQKFSILIGEGANLDSRVFFLGQGNDKLLVQDDYIFAAPDGYGRFLVTGVLKDESQAKYYSEVAIKNTAKGSDARIDMKLYLLNKGAKGALLPSLKIAVNEVKAGHGASTFKLSEEDLFYLASRGLSEQQVRQLIISSLLDNFFKEVSDHNFKENILKEISKLN